MIHVAFEKKGFFFLKKKYPKAKTIIFPDELPKVHPEGLILLLSKNEDLVKQLCRDYTIKVDPDMEVMSFG